MIYPAKRDWWATLIAGVACVAFLGIGFMLLIIAARRKDFLAVLPPFFLVEGVGVLYLWLILSTSYEQTATEIVVRLGPYRKRIPTAAITKVTSTTRFFPAGLNLCWSLDRMLIYYVKKNGAKPLFPVAISPRDKSSFLKELARRAPGLQTECV